MKKRILIIECKQEVSSFNPAESHFDDFLLNAGEAMALAHRASRNEVGGALGVFDGRADIEVVPVISARAITSGGPLAGADWRRLADDILQALRAAPPADAAYFSLHGAMAAVGEDDPEGYLLQEARAVLGERMPIVASFDLHGILTDRILTHADAIACFHTYPHVDFFETGERAARLLLKLMDGTARPVTAKIFIPAIVRGDQLITQTGAIRLPVNAAKDLETSGAALSAGLFWGNPFTDVSALGGNSFVVTDDDPALAQREAARIADLFWQHHLSMRVPLTPLRDAALAAQAGVGAGTTILVDAADATSSGAPGDSNSILRELLSIGYTGTALIPIVDPAAARAAVGTPVGQAIRVRVGGALDPRYTPVELEGRVCLHMDGHFLSESFSEHWYAAETAVVRAGGITLVITTRAVSLFDRALFWAAGQDPRKFDCVVVKSPHCEPHMFKDWAARYIDVDAPGATSANLRSLGHVRCARPMWPLDETVEFVPRVQLFSRPS